MKRFFIYQNFGIISQYIFYLEGGIMNQAFKHHRQRIFENLEEGSIVLLYAGNAPHKSQDDFYDFVVNRNFYYATGIDAPHAILMLIKSASLEKTMVFLEEDTELSLKWDGPKFSKDDALSMGGFETKEIYALSQFESLFNQLMNYSRSPFKNPPHKLLLDLYHPSVDLKPQSLVRFETIINHYKELEVKALNQVFSKLRMIKSDYEIEAMKKAITLTHEGLKYVIKNLKSRTNEAECAADFSHMIHLKQSSGHAFSTIAASGKNAEILHYRANNKPLEGDLILFDLGALNGPYASDISRTYPLSGTYQGFSKDVYEAVLDVQKKVIEAVKPGLTWNELNTIAKDLLAEKALMLKMIDKKEDISNVYYHSIGHFLGLDVHDVGLYDKPLEKGMVITIEPGLYGKGIGVRIEDNILVTDTGNENLSQMIEKEVKDIEALF